MTVRLYSPAKINLHLDILRRRPDGFHDLSTVFMALDWGDELELSPAPGAPTDTIEIDGPFAEGVPADSRNLAMRALKELRAETALPPVHIRLTKYIPAQAGLGGGSSNAAAVLAGCDRLFGLGLGDTRLEEIAARLGSDCAFFIRGGVQQGSGRGEQLRPIEFNQLFSIVVVVPRAQVSTAEAFAALDPRELGLITERDKLLALLPSEDVRPLPDLHNTFQRALCENVPEIAATLRRLTEFGADKVLLSGSGSACFGLFPVREEAENTATMWDLGARAIKACWPWPMGVQAS